MPACGRPKHGTRAGGYDSAMPAAARILDANANRARETLRVMEDAARFMLDDARLAAGLKQLRHDLAGALRRFDILEFNRDTPGDVGTDLATASERSRGSAAEVAIAAGKRLGEALRTIEEYGKTIDPGFAQDIQKLRYRGYDLEQRLYRRLGVGMARQWRICVILPERLCAGRDWQGVAESVCDSEPDCIQLREKDLGDAQLLRRARLLVRMARRSAVIVNDRADIALLAGAHGVHVGPDDLPVAEVRRTVGRRILVGASTSSLAAAEAALAGGADYCGLGPMFETTTSPSKTPVGPGYARAFIERFADTPHLAIGGITPDNVQELIDVGVRGVAVSSAVCSAEDPGEVVGSLRRALESAAPVCLRP